MLTIAEEDRPNPTRTRGPVGARASFAALVVAFTLVGCSVVASPSEPTTQAVVALEVSMEDLPEYEAVERFVVEMFESYSDATGAGYAGRLVPQTEDGLNYARDFLLILADLRSVFRFLPGTSSTDVPALEAQLRDYEDQAIEAERKFLSGEDFGVSFRITNPDGTEYISDGTNKSDD